MMKGQEPLITSAIVLSLTLGIAAFGGYVLSQSLDTGVENNLRLQSQRFASVIHALADAPETTTMVYTLPRTTCVVEITQKTVRIKTITGTKETVYETSIVQTGTVINKASFVCEQQRQISITKTDQNTITFQIAGQR